MRRAWPILAAALLLASPLAAAAPGRGKKSAAARALEVPGGPAGEFAFLAGLGLLALVLLGLALLVAYRLARPPPPKPRRKTFEAGRRLARKRRVFSVEEAVKALGDSPAGRLERIASGRDRVDVVLVRGRTQPCAQAAGYLAGLFESAWAREVRVAHASCAGDKGGACHYVVEPATEPGRVSGSGARAGAARTRG